MILLFRGVLLQIEFERVGFADRADQRVPHREKSCVEVGLHRGGGLFAGGT